MATATYSAGTMARDAIRILERRFRSLLPDETAAIEAAGKGLEVQGATVVLQDHAARARTLCEFLNMFSSRTHVDGSCSRRDCSVHGDGAVRTDAADSVSEARARYVSRLTGAHRHDESGGAVCPHCGESLEDDAVLEHRRATLAAMEEAGKGSQGREKLTRKLQDRADPGPERVDSDAARDTYHKRLIEAWRKP